MQMRDHFHRNFTLTVWKKMSRIGLNMQRKEKTLLKKAKGSGLKKKNLAEL